MSKKTTIWLIIAVSLVLFGSAIFVGGMTMIKWDFRKLSTDRYETNHHEIDEKYTNISIEADTTDIVFEYSENTKTLVACYEENKMKHSVTVSDGTLYIKVEDGRKWYEHIGIHFGTPKVTVCIPQGEYGTLEIMGSTGDVKLPRDFKFESVNIKESTGDIQLEDGFAGMVKISVTTGDVNISNLICEGDISVKVSTGKTSITDVKCQNLVTDGSTGEVMLKKAIAAETFSIERSTGDIKLDGCDAAEILIKTNTGDVKGSLLSDKLFSTHTNTGKVNVPKTDTGGRCEIRTNTGDIKIEIK